MYKKYQKTLLSIMIAAPAVSPSLIFAQSVVDSSSIEEIVISGRALQQIGSADAASEGRVSGEDLAIRPLLQVAELLEAVPGMVAVQHSGSGKANQYFMRGFNLDHGTDFSNFIDGVPINLRSHGHGQGYLDVNGLIPETVESIDYRKGTYRVEAGDFSMAGTARMQTIDSFDAPFISVETGSYGFSRYAFGGTSDLGDGQITGIAQFKIYDGPWEQPEELDNKSLWVKYSENTDKGLMSISLSGYSADWIPTEQIPEDSIGTEFCEDVFCSLDPSAEGRTDRWIATYQLQSDIWNTTAYAQYYDWEMSSNPTYYEQINQFDERWIFGGTTSRIVELDDDSLDAVIGAEFRHDAIKKVGVDFYENGSFIEANGDNKIDEASLGVYGELNWSLTDNLRVVPGLRIDTYSFDVEALNDTSESGSKSDSILSPKLAVAYKLADNVETYANWGYGFHSNDARGVVDDENPVEGLARGEGYEFGVRYERPGFNLTATAWWLNLDSELSFVGDSNSVEVKGASERDGLEFVGFWSPTDWLAIDAVYAISDARFKNPDEEGGAYVDGSVEDAGQLGLTINYGAWDISSRLRYLGEYALIPDNSERADSVSTLNLRVARNFERFSLYGEVINLTDEDGKDIVYYYDTSVNGNPNDAVEGRVSRQKEPRTYRVGLRYNFM